MKLLRINLTDQEIIEENLTENHPLYKYGGRALSSKIIASEVTGNIHPLEDGNKLIFASGLLGGTLAPNSGRISIGCKSPLTHGIKEANVGGRAPAYLARHNIRGIILEGISEEWVILHINDKQVRLIEASSYQGLNNYALNKRLLHEISNNAGIFSIGIAGEKQLKAASIASTDMQGYPSRHAGRGGVGAVMGSKKVKAIVIERPTSIEIHYHDKQVFKNIAKDWSREIFNSKRTFSKYGTAIGLKSMSDLHGLPTQNFRRGSYEDADKISGEALHSYIQDNSGKSGVACSPGCVIQCSNIVNNAAGQHITSSLEYETIALNGSNLQINSLEKLAAIDHACDDVGVDTIEIGNALGVYMETGKISWGDADAVLDLIYGISSDDPISLILGNGAVALGKKFNVQRVAHVKGQGISGYDPRTFKGMGVTFITSPMGADHTAGACIAGRKAYDDQDYGDLIDPNMKIALSRDLQIFTALLDSMGQCYFIGPSWDNMLRIAELLNARYGWQLTGQEIKTMGEDLLILEKEYNKQCGLPTISTLPSFMQTESLTEIDRQWDISDHQLRDFWQKF